MASPAFSTASPAPRGLPSSSSPSSSPSSSAQNAVVTAFHRLLPRWWPKEPFPYPPEGGWGWVVVFASWIAHCVVLGLQYSFGVLYRALLADVAFSGGGRSDAAWVGSLAASLMLGMGSLTGELVNRFGTRPVVGFGSILVCSGFLLSSFVTDLRLLYVTYGVLVGTGFSLSFAPSVMIVSRYFKKRRALATGFAVSGSGLGTFILGPISQLLIEAGGWRYCMRVLGITGGILLVLAACTYVPVLSTHTSYLHAAPEAAPAHSPAAAATTTVAAGKAQRRELSSGLASHEASSQHIVDSSTLDVVVNGSTAAPPAPLALPAPAPAPVVAPVLPPPQGEDAIVHQVSLAYPKLTMLQTWTHPAFVPMAIVLAIYGGCLFVPYQHIVVYGTDQGLAPDAAARLVSYLGIAGMAGRIIFGRIADSPRLSRVTLMQSSLMFAGFATFLLAFIGHNEGMLIAYALAFGCFSGSVVSMVPPIMVDYLGLDNLPHAQGGAYTAQFPAVLGAPPLAGYVRGVAGSYFSVWIVCGVLMSLSPLVLCFMPRGRKMGAGG
jgi:MFS family permease